MADDPKATVKIRFTKDTEEVFARDDGRRRTVKIPRGTIRMVRSPSARYWIRGMGVVEQVRDGSATTEFSRPPAFDAFEGQGLIGDLIAIRDGLIKQDTAPVYKAFKRVSAEELTGIDGLTSDSGMVLQAAFDEVAKTGGIDTVSITDLTDAVNEAITALGNSSAAAKPSAPRRNPAAASTAVPALPGVPKRGPGRPKAS